jgi:hypothetical protein
MEKGMTQALLKELLTYYPSTGVFRWKPRDLSWFSDSRSSKVWHSKYSGAIAGSRKKAHSDSGLHYTCINLMGTIHKAHRLAWLYQKGSVPKCITHKNRKGDDNSFENLMEISPDKVSLRGSSHKGSSSRYRGVSVHPQTKNFLVSIRYKKAKVHLGTFRSESLAAAVYDFSYQCITKEEGPNGTREEIPVRIREAIVKKLHTTKQN